MVMQGLPERRERAARSEQSCCVCMRQRKAAPSLTQHAVISTYCATRTEGPALISTHVQACKRRDCETVCYIPWGREISMRLAFVANGHHHTCPICTNSWDHTISTSMVSSSLSQSISDIQINVNFASGLEPFRFTQTPTEPNQASCCFKLPRISNKNRLRAGFANFMQPNWRGRLPAHYHALTKSARSREWLPNSRLATNI